VEITVLWLSSTFGYDCSTCDAQISVHWHWLRYALFQREGRNPARLCRSISCQILHLLAFLIKVTGIQESCHSGSLADDPGHVKWSNIINWESFTVHTADGCFCLLLANAILSTFPLVCSAWSARSDTLSSWHCFNLNNVTQVLKSFTYPHVI